MESSILLVVIEDHNKTTIIYLDLKILSKMTIVLDTEEIITTIARAQEEAAKKMTVVDNNHGEVDTKIKVEIAGIGEIIISDA
jgi:hypothetical protein